jgi:hypothetical protein
MSRDEGNVTPESIGTSAAEVAGNVAKVGDSKLLTLLFGRSAKAIGDFWGEKVEDRLKELRQRSQRKNVEDHLSKVVDVAGVSLDVQVAPQVIVRLERWFRVAADIPAEDVERSALIEAVLDSIVSKGRDTSEFQEAAEKLTNGTARLFLNTPAERIISPKEAGERGLEQLKSLGLAGPPGKRQLLNNVTAWVVGTVVGLIVLFEAVIRYGPTLLPRHFPLFLATEFIAEAVIASALLLVLGILSLSTRYRLTHLGKSLQRSANRFYRENRTEQGKSVWRPILRRTWIMWGGLAIVFICVVPFVLQAYLPWQFRFGSPPSVVVVSSPPGTQNNPPSPTPPAASPPSSAQQQQTLSADDLQRLVDFWRSVADQMDDVLTLTNDSKNLVLSWSQRMRNNGTQGLASDLIKKREAINQRRDSLQSLYVAFQNYPNVRAMLEEIDSKGFRRVYQAFTSLNTEIQTIGSPPPENYESMVRPYAGELKEALNVLAKWATSTRDFAKRQSDELSR